MCVCQLASMEPLLIEFVTVSAADKFLISRMVNQIKNELITKPNRVAVAQIFKGISID